MPIWVEAVILAAIFIIPILLEEHLGLDPLGRTAVATAAGLLLAGGLIMQLIGRYLPVPPVVPLGPPWLPWALASGLLIITTAVLLVMALVPGRPEPPPPLAGTCIRCHRTLYHDGSRHDRYLDHDDQCYLCPPEVRDAAYRRHQIKYP